MPSLAAVVEDGRQLHQPGEEREVDDQVADYGLDESGGPAVVHPHHPDAHRQFAHRPAQKGDHDYLIQDGGDDDPDDGRQQLAQRGQESGQNIVYALHEQVPHLPNRIPQGAERVAHGIGVPDVAQVAQ